MQPSKHPVIMGRREIQRHPKPSLSIFQKATSLLNSGLTFLKKIICRDDDPISYGSSVRLTPYPNFQREKTDPKIAPLRVCDQKLSRHSHEQSNFNNYLEEVELSLPIKKPAKRNPENKLLKLQKFYQSKHEFKETHDRKYAAAQEQHLSNCTMPVAIRRDGFSKVTLPKNDLAGPNSPPLFMSANNTKTAADFFPQKPLPAN